MVCGPGKAGRGWDGTAQATHPGIMISREVPCQAERQQGSQEQAEILSGTAALVPDGGSSRGRQRPLVTSFGPGRGLQCPHGLQTSHGGLDPSGKCCLPACLCQVRP